MWWIGFPVLTIFGERLELNRIMRPPPTARLLFTSCIILWVLALVLSHINRQEGWAMACILFMILAFWLIRYDIAQP